MEGKVTPTTHQNSNFIASNDETFVEIEDCREVRLSAGTGAFNSDYEEINTTKIERAWLQSRRLKAKDCAIFLVSGESMYPTLKDGEEIIVDRSKRELIEGKILVLNHNGAMLVKKVQFTYNGVELISDNPSYRPLKLDAEEANSLIIIGQVVRGYRNF
ncbi:S24 family peptidase [Rodentibacter myodis]|uniref:S24 family peptidase n=1 Tax=Rodentibacter myodis TaxID=1907939 RepID=UPI001FC993F7|nr:S24 family peptidase [Rodentibacter myodis]